MRTLARAATSSLVALGAALALVVVALAAIGIGGTRSATGQGNAIADDELTTSVVTAQLARSIDAAYAAGDPPAERADPDLFIRQWTAVRNLLSPPISPRPWRSPNAS